MGKLFKNGKKAISLCHVMPREQTKLFGAEQGDTLVLDWTKAYIVKPDGTVRYHPSHPNYQEASG